MPAARPQSRTGTAGAVLTLLGLVLFVLSRTALSGEHHAYAEGSAPATVQVTAGHTYHLSLRGGVAKAQSLGATPATLSCTLSSPATGSRGLSVTPEAADTKATQVIATFTAPVSGRVQVGCAGLPRLFVDDADGSAFDTAGLLVLATTVSWAVGVPLLLSGQRSRPSPAAGRRAQPVA